MKGKPREPAEGFCGYPAAAFAFFRGLAANNEKPWFEANRASYESAVKAATGDLIDAVSHALRAQDLPLEGDRKRSGFRIHRDVRFSKDKRPYKTAAGVVWYRQGSGKDGAGILYFHLDPGACFAAAAFYLPDPEVLGAIRERIRVHPDRFLSMQARLGEAGLTLDASDTLTRMPRGFEDLAGAETAPALRLKSFIVRRPITDKVAQSAAVVDRIVQMAIDALPLLQFGWTAIDDVRNAD